jgi:hypothetical protein
VVDEREKRVRVRRDIRDRQERREFWGESLMRERREEREITLNVRQHFRKKTKIEKINSKVKFEI